MWLNIKEQVQTGVFYCKIRSTYLRKKTKDHRANEYQDFY